MPYTTEKECSPENNANPVCLQKITVNTFSVLEIFTYLVYNKVNNAYLKQLAIPKGAEYEIYPKICI